MSMVLTRMNRAGGGTGLSVVLVTTTDELHTVQRLRHRVYVRDMGLVPADHPFVRGDRLVDPYDDYSSNLLLLAGDEAIGTLRVTEALDGPMELDSYMDVRPYLPVGAQPAELTRYMIDRRWRGTQAAPFLLYGGFRVIAASRSTHLVAASKLGSLSSYYSKAGLKSLGSPAFEYGLTGCTYELGAVDFGQPGSLRRLGRRALYGSLKTAANVAEPVAHLMFRRRLSSRPTDRLRTAQGAA